MKKIILQLCFLVLLTIATVPLQAQVTRADSSSEILQRTATAPAAINLKRLRTSAEYFRPDFEVLQQGEYSIISLRLPGNSAAKDYYVKKIGSKLYLNGDIIVHDFNLMSTLSYTTNNNSYTWPDGTVPVILDNSVFASDYYVIIKSALDYFNYHTSIIFKERTNESNYIIISCIDNDGSGKAGASPIGKGGSGGNKIELIKDAFSRGTVIHELMHALGIYHEQSRSDRDKYVEIKFDNIKAAAKHNFQIERDGIARGAYDYCSIMHYPAFNSFAIDETKPTLVCKNNGVIVACPGCVGNNDEPTRMDLDGLDALYRGAGVSRAPYNHPFESANVPISGCIGVTDLSIVDKWKAYKGALGDCRSGLINLGILAANLVRFEHGAIYHSTHGVNVVYGDIYKHFVAKGFVRFGFPTSDEEDIPVTFSGWRRYGYTRVSKFEVRTIIWGPRVGTMDLLNADYVAGPLTREQLKLLELQRTEPIRLQH
ncbi:astacin (peptidase family M12A) [Chitinophaga dinghuensis]|uniref:Astacin (Peptidase family M12A) n=1 Tax=Chitinophaga dinghuensis TaxID=1539050 RepID=A0A327VKM7_9BACT|nr:M12 family metallopeptidase [Chitinophaga dinghuensis]RAJ73728.1 astacin (peptidase family M12A) [Chitinophaga dinghuensis]